MLPYKKICTRLLMLSSIVCYQNSQAAEGGYSNYIPGFYGDIALAMSPDPGFSLKNDLYYYSADSSKAVLAGNVTANVDIELMYNYASLLYMTEQKFLGARYAAMVTIPYGGPDLKASAMIGDQTLSIADDTRKIGDLTFAPMMLYWNDGNFNYSFVEYVVAPSASYDADKLANPGLNYWTFETDFSASYTNLTTGQDYSILAGYNYNTENTKTDYQTGQEFHVDIILNQFLSETFAVGVQAFHLQQTTKDKGRGAQLGSFKARATGIGPSLVWLPASQNGNAAVTAKWIKEVDAKNRLEGDHFFISIALSL